MTTVCLKDAVQSLNIVNNGESNNYYYYYYTVHQVEISKINVF